MESNSADIQQLRSRLDVLINKQNKLRANVDGLRGEIADLQTKINNLVETETLKPEEPEVQKVVVPKETVVPEKAPKIAADKLPPIMRPKPETVQDTVERKPAPSVISQKPAQKSSFESFLGENLANKVGIAIILIGIGVGVKYAIDNNILGPAMRIALGYLAGAILIGVALYLKKKYENLSAVMFAGGMSVAYFVTFIGYDFYDLFPKLVAFGSMLVFTVITSLAAIRYDKQIIAIVGLIGAYAVPFLLQDESGTTFALLVYMTIINGGILFLAFRKNWQPVFSVAFGLTWFIFFILYARAVLSYEADYKTLFAFGSIFYVLFYAMLIANKMKYKEDLGGGGASIVILNSIFGYTFGIILINAIYDDSIINGVYTLLFTASQGLVTFISSKQKEANHRLYYLSFGFALIYATLSIPMMFDGNWITILWSLQAVLFFWIGWKKDDGFFEKITYLPLGLAFVSLLISWSDANGMINAYFEFTNIVPVFNQYFLAGIVLAGALFFMTFIKQKSEKPSSLNASGGFFTQLANSLIYVGIFILFISILKEIDIYWEQQKNTQAFKSGFLGDYFSSAGKLKTIWMLIFSLIFTGAIQLVNRYLFKDKTLSTALATASLIAIVAFLFIGLYDMSLLRDRALAQVYGNNIADYGLYFNIRYIGYGALGMVLWASWFSLRYFLPERAIKQAVEIFVHICLIWVICSELIHLKRMNGGGDFYRAGLTIFGGIYSFALIAYGIWKKKPQLRILALVLFGITLLKLFIYDIAKVDSGGKTIAFISLGVLLLVISFLYTKYKHHILPSEDDDES
ncbi:MAG: hypothetical protein COA38_13560 [Fluviicola sp.]|nr:MAG: hypothetical protein COA38_13560 [Fluviicola sp.]